MTPPRLIWLELEAFRGTAGALRIDLDADVVIMRGDNGYGKTTFVEGLLWLFSGQLSYLTERTKGMRRTEDPIVNRYSSGPARVRLAVRVNDESWEFERTGRLTDTSLTAWREGVNVSERGAEEQLAEIFDAEDAEGLSNAVTTWGVLRQDAVRAALSGGAAMHDRLAAIVGLERVNLFAESASRVARDLAQQQRHLEGTYADAKNKSFSAAQAVTEVRAEAKVSPSAPQVLQEHLTRAHSALPPGISIQLTERAGFEDVSELISVLSILAEATARVANLSGEIAQLDQAQSESLEDLERELATAQGNAHELARRSPLTVQLATSALQLLGPTCPVCGQAINEQEIRRHLTEVIEAVNTNSQAARSAEQAVAAAQSEVTRGRGIAASRKTALDRLAVERASLASQLRDTQRVIQISDDWLIPERSPALSDVFRSLMATARQAAVEAQQTADYRVMTIASAAETAERFLEKVATDYGEMVARSERAEALSSAARIAAQRIVERALAQIAPSFSEVFDRLAPHPTFTQLRTRQDVFYGKNQIVPEVYDPERDIAANPLLVYSEGQLNVIALSYFLGLALNARDGSLPFMILDDPLQALDILSVLGFADLCRHIREQRQLVITSHDRRFAEILLRKLSPRQSHERTVVVDFESWTRGTSDYSL